MPLCIEKKLTLSGELQTYACELVRYEPGFGILRYVIDREYDVAGYKLSPGDVTCALYWIDRPYTLYCWRLHDGARLFYFNIADSVTLTPAEFRWRDLAIDILIDAGGAARVLDENELPPDLPSGLAEYIRRAKGHVLEQYRNIVRDSRALLSAERGCPEFHARM